MTKQSQVWKKEIATLMARDDIFSKRDQFINQKDRYLFYNWVLFFARHYKIFVKKIDYFTVKKEFRGGEELNAFRENGQFLVNFVQP